MSVQAMTRAVRRRIEMTQATLAGELQVSQSLVAKWEGQTTPSRLPTVVELASICRVCGVGQEEELAMYRQLAQESPGAAGLSATIERLSPADDCAELMAWRAYATAKVDLRASA